MPCVDGFLQGRAAGTFQTASFNSSTDTVTFMQCMHDIPILCSSTKFLPMRPHAHGVLHRSRTVNIFELHEICMLAGKPVIASELFVYTKMSGW
jgi:hypothetical protein